MSKCPRPQCANGPVEEDPGRVPDDWQAQDQLKDVVVQAKRSRNAEVKDLAADRRPEQYRNRQHGCD